MASAKKATTPKTATIRHSRKPGSHSPTSLQPCDKTHNSNHGEKLTPKLGETMGMETVTIQDELAALAAALPPPGATAKTQAERSREYQARIKSGGLVLLKQDEQYRVKRKSNDKIGLCVGYYSESKYAKVLFLIEGEKKVATKHKPERPKYRRLVIAPDDLERV